MISGGGDRIAKVRIVGRWRRLGLMGLGLDVTRVFR